MKRDYKAQLEFYREHFEAAAKKIVPKLPLSSAVFRAAWSKMFKIKGKDIPKRFTVKDRAMLREALLTRPKYLMPVDLAAGKGCCLEVPPFFETQPDGYYATYHLAGGFVARLKQNKDFSTSVWVTNGRKKPFLLMRRR